MRGAVESRLFRAMEAVRPRRGAGCVVALLVLVLILALIPGCYRLATSEGGGQVTFDRPREVDPADVALPAGYRIEPVAVGLTFLSAVTVDDEGRPYVVESGYSYGEAWTIPRLLRIESDGSATVIATGERGTAPWTGVTYHDGAFYLAQGGLITGGRIVRIDPDGQATVLVDDIPTLGDHHTNGPAIGPDGKVYFAAGTATNSAVVGLDNYDFGWLDRFPEFHDVPAKDIVLAGRNYRTPNPLTPDPDDVAITGSYMPFGTPCEPGQVVPGRLPCNGAVMRIDTTGRGELELVAWGLRNPYGLAFHPDGRLFATENQYDVRGSRPVWGTGDLLWQIDWQNPGLWHGWPDFFAGIPLPEGFQPPGQSPPKFVLAEHPNEPPQPAAKFGVHASANGIAFPPNDRFGFPGHAFVAQFGDMAPGTGKVIAPVGFQVVIVEPDTGVIIPFAANQGPVHGPASYLGGGGLERPNDLAFSPDGNALYIADFGVMTTSTPDPRPRPNTGVLWRVTREPR